MKRCTFFRTVFDRQIRSAKAVKTDGFCETLFDIDGNKITLCLHKAADKIWVVTEKSTGFKICDGETKKGAFEKVKNEYLDLIFSKSQDANVEKYKGIISEAYALEEKAI